MTARSPSAFLLSAATHGLVVALALAFAWSARTSQVAPPQVLVLVAGAGDNYMATEAPALGTPAGVKFDGPQPVAHPVPPEPAIAPTPPAPTPRPVSPVVKAPPATKPPVSMARLVERVVDNKVAAAERQIKKDQAAAAITKAEFDKQNAAKNSTAAKTPSAIKPTHIDPQGIINGAPGGSTANKNGGAGGTALSREAADQLTAFQAFLMQRLRDAHTNPDGLSKLLQADVSFHVSVDGTLSGARIVRSSGNSDFDKSVLDAFHKVGPLGPTPTHQAYDWTTTFQMSDQL